MAQLPPHRPLPSEQPEIQYTQANLNQAVSKLTQCANWTCCLCWTYFVLAAMNAFVLLVGLFGWIYAMRYIEDECQYEQCDGTGILVFLGVLEIIFGIVSTIMAIIFSIRGIEAQRVKSRQTAQHYYKFFWVQLIVSMSVQFFDEIVQNILSESTGYYRFRASFLSSLFTLVFMASVCSCVYCGVKEFKKRVEAVAAMQDSVHTRHLVQAVPHIPVAVPVSEISQPEIEMEKM